MLILYVLLLFLCFSSKIRILTTIAAWSVVAHCNHPAATLTRAVFAEVFSVTLSFQRLIGRSSLQKTSLKYLLKVRLISMLTPL